MKWQRDVQYFGATDIGTRRSTNQDSWTVHIAPDGQHWEQQGHLFVVADGMGGHAVGELASNLATEMIVLDYRKQSSQSVKDNIHQSIQNANAHIYERACQNQEFQGMGTTATALLLLPEGALIAHVGDSRAYRIRDDLIEQLTFDHSLAWETKELAKQGIKSKESVEHIPNNIILRSLGPTSMVKIDLEGPFPNKPGETFLLCSDGLSGQITNEELGVLTKSLSPEEACRTLIDLANIRGGPDNITLVIAQLPSSDILSENQPRSWIPKRVFSFLRPPFRRAHNTRTSGKAPYRSAPCKIDPSQLLDLISLEKAYRQQAIAESWNVAWEPFFLHYKNAEQLRQAANWNQAFVSYSQSISILMRGKPRPK
ncbi:MAG: PP2C family serine/threonine-protein phosphatase [Planctomycetota bacterium]|nr:PP2C family serine/threonine-protein phosphatase [Planctomycetota bacterium]